MFLLCALTLGACNQSARTGTTPFFDAGTEAGLLVAGTAASYDPTGASSFAVAQATRAALLAKAAQSKVEWEQYRAQQQERIRRIPDKKMREAAEANLRLIGRGTGAP